MTAEVWDYSPQAEPPTLKRFAKSNDLVRFIVGPVGSGKSSRCVREIVRRACRQRPSPDGVRRSRCAVIRNTYSQLRDTTRKTFEQWVPAWMGTWHEQAFTFTLRMPLNDGTTVECEVLFRALDRPEDVKKLLSLELTFAYINEVREIPKHVVDVLETRIGRYPSRAQGGATWAGIWADTNPWHSGHWGAKLFAKGLPGYSLYRQPGGRSSQAENVENLPPGYYERLCVGKDREWVLVYVDGEDASGDAGSVWGAWLSDLESKGGVVAFDHPTTDVFTVWDLGKRDSTAIWFWRYNVNREVEVLDHYEAIGQGLTHYFGVLESKPYTYIKHWLPHDAKSETLATQQTVLEQCAARWGASKVGLVPNIGLDDGIGAARWVLEQPMRFHERCAVLGRLDHSGLDALREYRFGWDEQNQCFTREPIHNWASHTADAFRYLAVVVKHVEAATRPPKQDVRGPYAVPIDRSSTLDDAWRDYERRRRT